MICHTHVDTAWIETLNSYYQSSVKTILNSVVEQLQLEPERRFVFAEVAYIDRWY